MSKEYGLPQTRLKFGDEPRVVASIYSYVEKGEYQTRIWLCPNYPEIYARDIARGYRPMLDLAGSDDSI